MIFFKINPFVPNAPFFLPPANIRKPYGFQVVETGYIGNKWVNIKNNLSVAEFLAEYNLIDNVMDLVLYLFCKLKVNLEIVGVSVFL